MEAKHGHTHTSTTHTHTHTHTHARFVASNVAAAGHVDRGRSRVKRSRARGCMFKRAISLLQHTWCSSFVWRGAGMTTTHARRTASTNHHDTNTHTHTCKAIVQQATVHFSWVTHAGWNVWSSETRPRRRSSRNCLARSMAARRFAAQSLAAREDLCFAAYDMIGPTKHHLGLPPTTSPGLVRCLSGKVRARLPFSKLAACVTKVLEEPQHQVKNLTSSENSIFQCSNDGRKSAALHTSSCWLDSRPNCASRVFPPNQRLHVSCPTSKHTPHSPHASMCPPGTANDHT